MCVETFNNTSIINVESQPITTSSINILSLVFVCLRLRMLWLGRAAAWVLLGSDPARSPMVRANMALLRPPLEQLLPRLAPRHSAVPPPTIARDAILTSVRSRARTLCYVASLLKHEIFGRQERWTYETRGNLSFMYQVVLEFPPPRIPSGVPAVSAKVSDLKRSGCQSANLAPAPSDLETSRPPRVPWLALLTTPIRRRYLTAERTWTQPQ